MGKGLENRVGLAWVMVWNAGMGSVHACASGRVEAGFSGRDAASSM